MSACVAHSPTSSPVPFTRKSSYSASATSSRSQQQPASILRTLPSSPGFQPASSSAQTASDDLARIVDGAPPSSSSTTKAAATDVSGAKPSVLPATAAAHDFSSSSLKPEMGEIMPPPAGLVHRLSFSDAPSSRDDAAAGEPVTNGAARRHEEVFQADGPSAPSMSRGSSSSSTGGPPPGATLLARRKSSSAGARMRPDFPVALTLNGLPAVPIADGIREVIREHVIPGTPNAAKVDMKELEEVLQAVIQDHKSPEDAIRAHGHVAQETAVDPDLLKRVEVIATNFKSCRARQLTPFPKKSALTDDEDDDDDGEITDPFESRAVGEEEQRS